MERALRSILLFILLSAFGRTASAQSALPSDFTVEGRLFDKTSGLPLTANTTITLQLLDTDSSCVLYAEDHAGVVLGSSSGSADGYFALRLGTGVRNFPAAPVNMASLFSNSGTLTGNGCPSFTPGTHRSVRVIVGAETLSPDTIITAVPTATLAESARTLQGLEPSSFLLTNTSAGLTQSNVENVFLPANYGKLTALFAGSYVSSTPAANVDLNYHNITNVAAPSLAGDAVNKAYSDSTLGGHTLDLTGVSIGSGGGSTLVWDDVLGKWAIGSPAAGVALIATGNGLSGGVITATGTISVDTGTTANKILQLNGSAKIPAVDGSLLTNLNALTALTGDVTTSGSVATIADNSIRSAKINSTGIAKNLLLITDNTVGSDVTYMSCALGQVLQWDANGWGCVDMSAALGNTGVTAGTYGANNMVARVTVDAQGRVTALTNVNINFPVTDVNGRTGSISLLPSDIAGLGDAATRNVGTANGELIAVVSGGLPGLDGSQLTGVSAAQIAGRTVNTGIPTDGQILTWNNAISQWQALPAPSGNPGTVTFVSAGTGLQAGSITSVGTLNVDVGTSANKILQLTSGAQIPAVDGNLVGNVNAVHLRGRAVSSTNPGNGQVLTWNNVTNIWEPGSVPTAAPAGSDGMIQFNNNGSYAGAANLFWDSVNSRFGVGTAAPAYTLHSTHATTNPGGGVTSLSEINVQNSTGSGSYYGTYSTAIYNVNGGNLTSSGGYSNLTGLMGASEIQDGAVHSAAGVRGTVQNFSSDAMQSAFGVESYVAAQNGNIVNAVGISGGVDSPGSATITNGYGLYSYVNGTNVNTGYGLYIGNVSGNSASYGIYQTGGFRNYFASRVGINQANPQADLHINGNMWVDTICDENGNNCKALSSGWGPSGTVTLVSAGTGMVAGSITSFGTLNVDVGTTANKVLQLTSGAQIPAVDGYLVGNVNAQNLQGQKISSSSPAHDQVLKFNTSGSKWEPATLQQYVTTVAAGTGLVAGNITSSGTLNVDVGTSANQIMQLTSSAQIPAVDGFLVTNVSAVQLQARRISSTAPSASQVLGWNGSTLIWEPQSISTSFPLSGSNGTSGAPTYAFANANTGLYSSGASNISLSFGGSTRYSFDNGSAAFSVPSVTQSGSSAGTYATSGGTTRPIAVEQFISNSNSANAATAQHAFRVINANSNTQEAYIGAVAASGASNYSPSIVFGHSTGSAAYTERMRIDTTGNVGIGLSPSAGLHLRAGTNSTHGAPLKIAPGTLLGAAEPNAIEYDGVSLYYTDNAGTRRTLANTGVGTVESGALYQLAYYGAAGTTVGGLPSMNNAVLLTNGSGEPAWSLITNDTFTQYARLGGRSGGQILYGGSALGDDLTLESTAHGSKGDVLLNPNGGFVGIAVPTPTAALDVSGAFNLRGISTPSVSAGGSGKIYFDSTAYKFKVSENNASYVFLATSGGAGGGLNSTSSLTFNTNSDGSGTDAGFTVQNNGATAFTIDNGGNSTFNGNTTLNGHTSISGTNTFSTGTGTVSLNGDTTLAASKSFVMAPGSGTFDQTFSGSGPAFSVTGQPISSGGLVSFTHSTVNAANGDATVNVATSGPNSVGSVSRIGIKSNVIATGATSTNIGAQFSASGATNNYGLLVTSGNVGIGASLPHSNSALDVGGLIYVGGFPALTSTSSTTLGVGRSLNGTTTTGSDNTAVGQSALSSLSTGVQNTAVGYRALRMVATTNNNTAIGRYAGDNVTGSNNTLIGSNTALTLVGGGRNIIIGFGQDVPTSAPGTSDFINIGGIIFAAGANGTVSSPGGRVGIGTPTPNAILEVTATGTQALLDLNSGMVSKFRVDTNGNLKLSGGISGTIVDVTIANTTITNVQNGYTFAFQTLADGSFTLPSLSTVPAGFNIKIARLVSYAVDIAATGGDTFSNGTISYEMRKNNAASVVIAKYGSKWVITDKADDCTTGETCWGATYIGTLRGYQYFTTPTESFSAMNWSSSSVLKGAANHFDGLDNSTHKDGTTTAMNACDTLTDSGYSDWFLPSNRELEMLTRANPPVFQYESPYWSSTESAAGFAWYYSAQYMTSSGNKTGTSARIRCVRRQ